MDFYKFESWGISFGEIIKISCISFFILLEVEDKKNIFRIFSCIFAICLIPAIVIFLCNLMEINIPYSVLDSWESEKQNIGAFYRNYGVAVVLDSPLYFGSSMRRLCGLFNEPGVVGTISSLILIGRKAHCIRELKIVDYILLLGGICSFSLAFFFLYGGYFVLRNFLYKTNECLLTLSLLLLFFLMLWSFLPNNHFMRKYFFDRIEISREGLSGDNRMGSSYSREYALFLERGDIIWGEGKGRSYDDDVAGSSSYTMLIWDYGFLGFSLIMMWLMIGLLLVSDRSLNSLIVSA